MSRNMKYVELLLVADKAEVSAGSVQAQATKLH